MRGPDGLDAQSNPLATVCNWDASLLSSRMHIQCDCFLSCFTDSGTSFMLLRDMPCNGVSGYLHVDPACNLPHVLSAEAWQRPQRCHKVRTEVIDCEVYTCTLGIHLISA